jgi:hypothetical protein
MAFSESFITCFHPRWVFGYIDFSRCFSPHLITQGLNIPKGALSGIPDARLKEFCRYLQIDTSLVKRG